MRSRIIDDPTREVLSLYLLQGIKKYNDAYGRACGDVLLAGSGAS